MALSWAKSGAPSKSAASPATVDLPLPWRPVTRTRTGRFALVSSFHPTEVKKEGLGEAAHLVEG